MLKQTKTELAVRVEELGELLFEAITFLRGELAMDEDEEEEWKDDFLVRCQLKGLA